MTKEQFTVVFTNHNYRIVRAFGKEAAIILAQAKQINSAESYNVAFVKDKNGDII